MTERHIRDHTEPRGGPHLPRNHYHTPGSDRGWIWLLTAVIALCFFYAMANIEPEHTAPGSCTVEIDDDTRAIYEVSHCDTIVLQRREK